MISANIGTELLNNDQMKTLTMILSVSTLCSCGLMTKLSDDELQHRAKIDYEMDKLYADYKYQTDSLIIEYYKKPIINQNK